MSAIYGYAVFIKSHNQFLFHIIFLPVFNTMVRTAIKLTYLRENLHPYVIFIPAYTI